MGKKAKHKIQFIDELTGEKYVLDDAEVKKISSDSIENTGDLSVASPESVTIEFDGKEFTPALYRIMMDAERQMIGKIKERIKTLRRMKQNYIFEEDEIETVDMCIKNYDYNLELHEKHLEKMKDTYKKQFS